MSKKPRYTPKTYSANPAPAAATPQVSVNNGADLATADQFEALLAVMQKLQSAMAKKGIFDGTGLSYSGWVVLKQLVGHDSVAVTPVVRAACMSLDEFKLTLKALENANLVTHYVDEVSAQRMLSITSEGTRVVEDVTAKLAQVFAAQADRPASLFVTRAAQILERAALIFAHW